MVKNHLKKLTAPKTWGIKRKDTVFVTRPFAGAHSLRLGLPVSVVLKDLLGIAKTSKEVKRLLYHRELFIDTKPRFDLHFITGLFDIVSFPNSGLFYRMILNSKGKLDIIPIEEKEGMIKLSKIVGKSLVKGKIQLNCGDGRSILTDKKEFKTGDSLLIDLPGQNIKDHLKLENGAVVFLTGGKHIGDHGKVEKIEDKDLFYKSSNGKSFQTLKKYAFVVGKEKPVIKIFEK